MNPVESTFGGRLRPKATEPTDWSSLVALPNERLAFVYKRLSTYEQVRKSVYSIKAQDALYELARDDGYPKNLIYIGERDLGISGTLGSEHRPELAHLIDLVKAEKVEAVYTIHISRLYRDQTLINALTLGELFKEHNVIVVTPQMRLNLKDKMHMRLYRMEVERAADELELMALRMLGAREIKAKSGRYAGEKLPPGYVVDERANLLDGTANPHHHTYLIHEPHAAVIREIYNLILKPGMSLTRVARYCVANGIAFPPFPQALDTPANRKTFVRSRRLPNGAWPMTVTRVNGIIRNPAYIGWKVWGGAIVSKVYPPIIDEELFWTVQENHGRSGSPKKNYDPLPLAGILYCGNHAHLKRMAYSNNGRSGTAVYQCYDGDLRAYCCTLAAHILDGPLGEAIIGQLTLPGLADRILDRLTDEYESAKEKTAGYRREIERLDREISNLRANLSSGVMSADQLQWVDEQISARLGRIRELADLENRRVDTEAGLPVSRPEDIDLIRVFLSNLDESWPEQPNALKNALLRLVLDKVIIWAEPAQIRAKLIWRTGLEQELLIGRTIRGCWDKWSDEETATLRTSYPTLDPAELMAILPKRTWKAIKIRAKRLGIRRTEPLSARRSDSYTEQEDNLIRQFYAGEMSLEQLMKTTRRSENSIDCRARRMGLGHRVRERPWRWLDNGKNPGEIDDSSTYSRDSSR